MKYLDAIDPVAREIGAVNAIVNDDGCLTGHNVDWMGAEAAIKEVTEIRGCRFLVLGAGGAARSICYALRRNGAEIVMLNRDGKKAETLAREFGINSFGSLSEISKFPDYDVLVNATSVGFFDTENCAVPESAVPHNRVVFEVVFYPVKTKLVQMAEARGCRIIPGVRMLVHLAMKQFELYTGEQPRSK